MQLQQNNHLIYMFEQSKSAKRRYYDGNFLSKYFVGNGLDVGCGSDSIGQYMGIFPMITSVTPWDKEDGDAMLLASIPDESYNFVHASHSLEHMSDPVVALTNWFRVVRTGGHIIVTIPDEDMYEHGIWPSQYNPEHHFSFTICKDVSMMPRSVNVTDLVKHFANVGKCVKIQLLDDFYRSNLSSTIDQTMLLNAECGIEIIWKKR
jgi:SAM-dependent methyltransferase